MSRTSAFGRRLAATTLVVVSCLGLASCDSPTLQINAQHVAPPAPPPGTPFVETGFAESREAFRMLSGPLLGMFVISSNGASVGNAEGLIATLSPDASTLTLQFQNETLGAVGAPIVLRPDPAFSGGFIARDVSAFGRTDLIFSARVRDNGPDGIEIALLVRSPDAERVASKRVVQTSGAGHPDRVRALQRHWVDLQRVNNICNPLERFATFLQDIADTNLALAPASEDPDTTGDLIIDDMVDLFVPGGFFKSTIMLLDPVINEVGVIGDPQLACNDANNLAGFKTPMNRGEGRFRHFSANAGMKRVALGFMVNIGARFVGGDWEFKDDPDGDIQGDLETNAQGRAFQDFLDDLLETPAARDGRSVHDWIRDNVGAGVIQDAFVTLDFPTGPHAAGNQIGFCRISRACRIGGPDACPTAHMHSNQPEGILIDGAGPYTDPNQPACGFGRTAVRTYP